MTNENKYRPLLVGAAVILLAAGVLARELIRSGTVGRGLIDQWYVQAGLTAGGLAVAGTALYLLYRAYRRRTDPS